MEPMGSSFSEWLNREIRQQGWSLRTTASKLDIAHTTIIRIANGKNVPSPELANRMAALFGVPARDVFALAGLMVPAEPPPDETSELVARLDALPEDLRQETLALFNALLSYRRRIAPSVEDRVAVFRSAFAALTEEEQEEALKELNRRVFDATTGARSDPR